MCRPTFEYDINRLFFLFGHFRMIGFEGVDLIKIYGK